MTLPRLTRSAMLSAGSPDPAAKSSTTELGVSAAAESSASVIAVFQRAAHAAHRSLARACAAASHESRVVISLSRLHSSVEISIKPPAYPDSVTSNDPVDVKQQEQRAWALHAKSRSSSRAGISGQYLSCLGSYG
jgi:hypothetical protein